MSNRALPLGLIIIAAGIIIMLGKLGVFQAIGLWLWPLLLLLLGLSGQLLIRNGALSAIFYIPAAMLAGLSITFLWCVWFGWKWMGSIWPLIPISLAAGLYQFSAAERHQGARSWAWIIGGFFALVLVITLLYNLNGYVIAAILIIAGIVMIARRFKFR